MDWHKLQHTLYNIDPTDPREDLAKLQQSAQQVTADVSTVDYLTESVEVPKGSMPVNINSINDFARLAGVTTAVVENDKKSGGFAAGWQSTKPGGVLGPDAISNRISKALNPGGDDNKKNNQPTNARAVNIVDRKLQKDFDSAIAKINRNEPITDSREHAALASAFRKLLSNPKAAERILANLKSQSREDIQPRIETVDKTQYGSIKEELYKMLRNKG